jgi:ABC-type nickel/cobalt efflux system permease component RcnA
MHLALYTFGIICIWHYIHLALYKFQQFVLKKRHFETCDTHNWFSHFLLGVLWALQTSHSTVSNLLLANLSRCNKQQDFLLEYFLFQRNTCICKRKRGDVPRYSFYICYTHTHTHTHTYIYIYTRTHTHTHQQTNKQTNKQINTHIL